MPLKSLPTPARVLALALLAAALLALLAQFAVYVDYTAALLRFPFDYDQGEGFELYDTVLHAQGEWPYRDSQVYPFYTSIYPPLFHLLTVPLVWAFGPQLWTGRLVGFTASLIAAGALAWGVYRASGSRSGVARVIGVLSGLAFLASNYTFHIGPLFRQHMTMVMFETLAIVALAQLDRAPSRLRQLARRGRSEAGASAEAGPVNSGAPAEAPGHTTNQAAWTRQPAFWLGLAALLAAGYTKQLALATVIAGLGYLFLRGPRRAVLAGAGLALVAGGLYAAIDVATQGQWTISIIRANINAFDSGQALLFYRQWAGLHLVLAALALGRLVYEAYLGRLSAYGVWFALALANGALSGKFGAGESYFVTTTAAAAALSGLALARLWQCAPQWRAGERGLTGARAAGALALAIPLLYLVQARLTLHTYTAGPIYEPVARALGVWTESGYYDSQGYTQLGPKPTAADIAAGEAIASLARNAPGPVFSEEAGFVFRAGKPVVTNPFPQLVMYQAGLFDPAEEIAMIERQAFGLVILRAQFYPPPVLAALGAHYQPQTEIRMNGFLYRLLVPRPR